MRIKSPVFVGRRSELELLTGWLAAAREGSARVVVIGGEAGIGKSRLVTELAGLAEAQGACVLSGAAADYGEGGLPFGAVMEAFRPHTSTSAAGLPGISPDQPELARLSLPELRRTLSQERMFELLLGLLERLSRDRLTVLVLEDLHWADASTREFLAFLARNISSVRLLVVGTYRADDVRRHHPLRRYLAELGRGGRIERISLARFERDEARQQLEAIAGRSVDEELVGRLFERSQGNPFFIEEVFAADAQGSSLPPDLRELLLARLDELSERTRSVLSAAAVAGRADDEFLATVTALPAEDVAASVREAIDGFVLERTAEPAVLGHAFRHALLREAIYDELLAGERIRLHRRVAELMSDSLEHGRDATGKAQLLAQLAHHWEQARQPSQALLAAWRAGIAAEQAMAYPEASRQFSRLLELWPAVPEPERLLAAELERDRLGEPADRAYVFERAALAAHTGGDLQRAAQLWQQAAAEVNPRIEPDRAALIQLGLADSLNDASEGSAADEATARAAELLGPGTAPSVRARVLIHGAGLRVVAGRPREALAEIEDALTAAQESGDVALQAEAHVGAGSSLAFMGRLEDGLAHYRTARSIADAAGLIGLVAGIDKWCGVILDAAARFDEALATLEASQLVGRELGYVHMVRHTDAVIAQSMQRSGRWQEALAAIDRSLARPASDWGRVIAAYIYVGLGRFEEASRQLEVAWDSVRLSKSSASYGPYFAARVEMAIWQGDPSAALDSARQGLVLVEEMSDLRWATELTRLGMWAAGELGARDDASRLLEHLRAEALPRLAEGNIFDGETRAGLATAEAEMSRLDGQPSTEAWSTAADAWLRLKEPYPAAYALFRQAEEMLAQGRRRAAAEPLGRALRHVRDLGAEPLLGQIEALARRGRLDLGVAQPAGRSADEYGLTAREREVLAMLAAGSTDQQIAKALFISAKTASVHVSNIKAKLGVEHRIEASAIALRMGLTEGPAAAKLRPVEEIGR